MRRIRSIAADIRAMGSAGWIVYAVDRALGLLFPGQAGFHVLRFYAQPVPGKELIQKRAKDSFSVGVIGRDTVPESAFARPAGAISQRFDDGSICIAARRWRNWLVSCGFSPEYSGNASSVADSTHSHPIASSGIMTSISSPAIASDACSRVCGTRPFSTCGNAESSRH